MSSSVLLVLFFCTAVVVGLNLSYILYFDCNPVFWIRIHWFRIRIRIQGIDNQNKLRIYSWKKIIFLKIKNCHLLIPRPPRMTSKLHEKPSALKREHTTFQNMIFLNFFLLLWVIFAPLVPHPDPLTWLNLYPIRIRIGNTAAIYGI